MKVYAGEWQRGQMHGHGQHTDVEGNVYIGQFVKGKRNGTGRLEMANGDVYEGEWENDLYHGAGVLTYHTGNVFEGRFSGGKKEGPGKHFYASTDKVYEGEWVDDTPRCGYIREPDEAERHRYTLGAGTGFEEDDTLAAQRFVLPTCELVDPAGVVAEAVQHLRVDKPSHHHSPSSIEQNGNISEQMEVARQLFETKCAAGSAEVPLIELQPVLAAFGLEFSFEDLADLAAQLEITMETVLSFEEVAEIAACITEPNDTIDVANEPGSLQASTS